MSIIECKPNQDVRICPTCGEGFIRNKSGTKKFCGAKCSAKSRWNDHLMRLTASRPVKRKPSPRFGGFTSIGEFLAGDLLARRIDEVVRFGLK